MNRKVMLPDGHLAGSFGGDVLRIAASAVSMSAQHRKVSMYERNERLNFWHGATRGKALGRDPTGVAPRISYTSARHIPQGVEDAGDVDRVLDGAISPKERQRLLILKAMIERLTGERFEVSVPQKAREKCDLPAPEPQPQRQQTASRGWGVEYDLRESFHQKETMTFEAEGLVETSDGRQMAFSVKLNMTKEFAREHHIRFRAGDAVKVDPLVIHYDTLSPYLTDSKYEFDLDADGNPDSISFVAKGSGLLAIDLNGDGIINNGHELFGPNTGNGFGELSAYDEDHNGWLDENDSVYKRLLIWSKDEDGTDRLFALGQKGVGAIYLGNIDTPFDLSDGQNLLRGQMARSGVFLMESGEAGVIQHIDFVV